MTAHEILTLVRSTGIRLEARGDRLHVDAPCGALTPELRDALARHKAELLAVLTSAAEYVMLRGGLVLPTPALRLAWDLEARGVQLRVDRHHQLVVDLHDTRLSAADRAAIQRWRLHLGAFVEYQASHMFTDIKLEARCAR